MITDVRFNRPILSAGEMTCKHIKSAPIKSSYALGSAIRYKRR